MNHPIATLLFTNAYGTAVRRDYFFEDELETALSCMIRNKQSFRVEYMK